MALSFPFYSPELDDLPDDRFAGDTGLGYVAIDEKGRCVSRRIDRSELTGSLNAEEDNLKATVKIYHFEDHSYMARSFIRNVIGISRDELQHLFAIYDISPAFQDHLFGGSLAVGTRVINIPHHLTQLPDSEHLQTKPNNLSSDPTAGAEKMQTHYHVWYTLHAGSGIRNVEVYSRIRIPSGNLTVFALRFPNIIRQRLDDTRITSSWLEEPFRFHVHLVEVALKSWNVDYRNDLEIINDTEASTYHARSEQLSSDRIIMLHAHLRTLQRQSLKVAQLAMCIPRLKNAFASYEGLMAPFNKPVDFQVSKDLEYLAHQAKAMENKYADAKKRLELLLQLNYYLMNEKATRNSQEMAEISIDDNRFMKNISEQSKRIAEEAKRDSSSMKALTIVAVLAIPTTVVSSICGTNFIMYDGPTDQVYTSVKIWIVFFVSVSSSLLIAFLWWLWNPELKQFTFKRVQYTTSD